MTRTIGRRGPRASPRWRCSREARPSRRTKTTLNVQYPLGFIFDKVFAR